MFQEFFIKNPFLLCLLLDFFWGGEEFQGGHPTIFGINPTKKAVIFYQFSVRIFSLHKIPKDLSKMSVLIFQKFAQQIGAKNMRRKD